MEKKSLSTMQQLHPKQNLTQRLIMTAQMQQALTLLQIPLLELEPFIEENMAANPLLELEKEEGTEELFPQENDEEKEIC